MPDYKPISVIYAKSAAFRIHDYPVADVFVHDLFPKSFMHRLVDPDRDISDGTIRYRHFGHWVVTFQVSELEDRVSVLILEVAMPVKTSFAEDVFDRLDRIAKALMPGYSAIIAGMTPKGTK